MVLPLGVQIYNPSDPIRISNLGYTKKKKKNYLRAGCGWNVQQMGSQKQGERPLSYAMCAQDASLG